MAKEKTPEQPTLTDLALSVETISKKLQHHTAGRNYLMELLQSHARHSPSICITADDLLKASIPLAALPQDVSETILYAVLEREENAIIAMWQHLGTVVAQAAAIIQSIRQAQQEAVKRVENEESPIILKIQPNDAPPEFGEPYGSV